MKKSYDNIAFVYDRLARLVYGRALLAAQRFLVRAIPPGAHVLIVGGGTGWILEEIAQLHPSGLTITYIDSSAAMIALARTRNAAANTLHFVTAPVEALTTSTRYHVVLTPFLFDNFTTPQMAQVFALLHNRLHPSALWLYCDFKDTGKLWQKAMLRIMYTFFRLTCGISASSLPNVEAQFQQHHYTPIQQHTLLHGFITAIIYSKPE